MSALAELVLKYEAALDSQDVIPDETGELVAEMEDHLPEVIVPGRLWAAWLKLARLESPVEESAGTIGQRVA